MASQGAPKKEKRKRRTYLPPFFGLILESIFVVFLSSSGRETAKNAIKKTKETNHMKKKSPQIFGHGISFFLSQGGLVVACAEPACAALRSHTPTPTLPGGDPLREEGQVTFSNKFCMVFLDSPQKRHKKKIPTYLII
jgi:hypothetical protein